MPLPKAPPNFAARSRQVAEHFIQSIVVLDDLADFNSEPAVGVGELTAPTFENNPGNQSEVASESQRIAVHPETNGFRLDAKAVIDGFAELGSVCAVLKPIGDEEFHPRAIKAASRADIVVLDWKIGSSYGDDTLELMRLILADDANRQRLRLLAVYTGEGGLQEITKRVGKIINCFYDSDEFIKHDEFRLSKGPVHAVVLAKEGSLSENVPGMADQVVSDAGLPHRLLEEFARVTSGLMCNVALEGLAALRDHVHQLLSKFDKNLDPAYLGHRMLLQHPSDSETHAVEVLGAEILSILEGQKAGDEANIEAISEWLTDAQNDGLDLSIPFAVNGQAEPSDAWLKLLTVGYSSAPNLPTTKRNLEKRSTEVFCGSKEEAIQANRMFSALMKLKTRYSTNTPRLTLGTILRLEWGGRQSRYYMCLQPKCDSVRLKQPTGFPLLPLVIKNKNDSNATFNLVISLEDGAWEHLEYQTKPSELAVRTFEPGPMPPGEITGTPNDEEFFFWDKQGRKYKWIAEVKDEHALKVVGNLANAIARPGPNDVEWLRLASPRTPLA